MKTEKTFKELNRFNLVADAYLKKHKDAENKLCKSIHQFSKQLEDVFEEVNEEFENIRIDNCAIDEKTKVVLKNADGSYQFTKDGLKIVVIANKEIYNKKFELNARIVTEVPDDLTQGEIDCFSGIVIPVCETVEAF